MVRTSIGFFYGKLKDVKEEMQGGLRGLRTYQDTWKRKFPLDLFRPSR
jgi:hypothetical protein